MRDVHVELNPELAWQKQRSTRTEFYTPIKWTNLMKKLAECKIRSVALCGAETWTKGSRSEILGRFGNVVLEEYGENQLGRSCEK